MSLNDAKYGRAPRAKLNLHLAPQRIRSRLGEHIVDALLGRVGHYA
jgi:hypothetical protein